MWYLFSESLPWHKTEINFSKLQVLNFLSISILSPVRVLVDFMSVYNMIFRTLTVMDPNDKAIDRIPTSLIVWD